MRFTQLGQIARGHRHGANLRARERRQAEKHTPEYKDSVHSMLPTCTTDRDQCFVTADEDFVRAERGSDAMPVHVRA